MRLPRQSIHSLYLTVLSCPVNVMSLSCSRSHCKLYLGTFIIGYIVHCIIVGTTDLLKHLKLLFFFFHLFLNESNVYSW